MYPICSFKMHLCIRYSSCINCNRQYACMRAKFNLVSVFISMIRGHARLLLLLLSPETLRRLLLFNSDLTLRSVDATVIGGVWAVQTYQHYIYYSDANYLVIQQFFMASLRSGLVMILPPHHIPVRIHTELCTGLWILLV